jgi:glycosyltransferase involved in cell wall biosynthesis
MIPDPLRVLCLDIEGGYGGSSRSLFYLLRHLDPAHHRVEVWCRRSGPIVEKYREIGVPVRVVPEMPKVSALPRPSRSAWAHLRFALDFARASRLRNSLVEEINQRFDVVHFNHEALYLLASWLRRRTSAAFVMHNRTQLWDTGFARMQARRLVADNDLNVFITEREKENICRLARWSGGRVIHNVVEMPVTRPAPHAAVPMDSTFRIACLSNFSWGRGIDRIVDVAVALKTTGRADIRFVVAGDMRLSGSLPGRLGKIAAKGGTLADYAADCDVGEMFVFVGHVDVPESVLSACHALIKPSREDNPWGRDILEALSFGLPVLACGSYEKFVQPGVSGYLHPHDDRFDPSRVAANIVALASDGGLHQRMSAAARNTVMVECNGPGRAADLADAWRAAYSLRALDFARQS